MSRTASNASASSTDGSTLSSVRPAASTVEIPSVVTRRYGVSSSPNSKIGW